MRAWGFDACGRTRRMALAATLALALPIVAGGPAAAQFVCTATATDSTCTNSGAAAGNANFAAGANQNATSTNGGTNTGGFSVQTGAGGNASATNNGTNAGGISVQTFVGGNAAVTNNGANTGFFAAQTLGPGNASAINNGVADGFSATASNGSATAINTGTNSGGFGASATNGTSTVTNSGNNSGSMGGSVSNGSATVTNSGVNSGGILFNGFGNANISVTNSGTNTGGITAMSLTTGDVSIANSGSNAGGIIASTIQGNASATNSGTNTGVISAMALASGNATVVNSGTTVGGISANSFQGDASATNSGTNIGIISVIASNTGNASVVNSGTNTGDIGLIAVQGNASAINSGTNGGLLSVVAGNGNATVVNSGTTGQVSLAAAGTSTLTNSGLISNFGGAAITFLSGADTLNVLPGSRIIGDINLVGTNDRVNFFTGNQNLTFNTLSGATVTGNVPFVVVGNRAVTIDPTPFGLADKGLMDFTRGIASILGSLGGASAAPNGPISSAFAPTDTVAARVDEAFASIAGGPALAYAGDQMMFKNPTMVDRFGRAVWARGFGGAHVQDGDGPLLRSINVFMGGAFGFDVVARPDLRLGLFAGAGQSRLTLDANQGRTDTNTAFGGLYGRWGFVSFGAPSFIDFALHGGGSSNSTSRNVNNNTLPNGLETATASYNSWYVSPEIAYGLNLGLGGEYTLTPSLRVRYVAGVFDGYTETGTTAPLSAASRTIGDFEERGELKLTRAHQIGPDLLLTSIYLGALGVERAGDTTVNTVLLGANLPFVTPGRSNVAGVLGGGGIEWRTREGISLFGAAEAIGMSDQGTVISARGGIRAAF